MTITAADLRRLEAVRFFVAGVPRAMSVGRVIVTKRGSFQARRNNEWALQVGYAGREVRPATPFTGPLAFTAIFWMPRPKSARRSDHYPIRRPDLDNLVHKLTDQFNGVLYDDDSQIVRFTIEKRYVTDNLAGGPGIAITVQPLAEIVPPRGGR